MRNGKIAKLPGDLRDELNLRMENGEDGATLLTWLNGLPEVQETLHAGFDGVPISRQNLCQWRHGGFREWQIQQDFINHAFQLSENARDMEEIVDTSSLPGDLVLALASRYAALLNTWDGEPDPKFEKKLRPLRAMARDIALIERTMQRARHQKTEHHQQLETESRAGVAEVKQEALAPFWGMLHRNTLTRLFAGENKGKNADKAKRSEQARKVASLITAIMYDLPVPKKPQEKPTPSVAASEEKPLPSEASLAAVVEAKPEAEPEPPRQTRSKPVKPSQTLDK
ncbi:MAG: hypothetical protein ABSA47_06820 [Verrucomicrobiota bacterium]|jgi:hypothetical protein